jgi:hypothetical protein
MTTITFFMLHASFFAMCSSRISCTVIVNVSLGVLVAVFKGALLLGLAPKVRAGLATIVVAVGVEGRVNVNQIHAGVGHLGELFQIVAAVDDARVEEGAWA